MNVRVSAPGKSILMGEHAAVYGRPALIAAVDRRTVAEMQTRTGAGVDLDLPLVGVCERVSWGDILTYTRRCRAAWETYRDDPKPDAFSRVRGNDPAHLVKIALGEAMLDMGEREPAGIQSIGIQSTGIQSTGIQSIGIRLRLDSAIPLGAGFGSSAAAAVAVAQACLAWHGVSRHPEDLQRLTLEVERRQHGLPSGVDNATVIHGGLVRATRQESEDLVVAPLTPRSDVLEQIHVFHTGTPAETTGAVVASVRALRESDPRRFDGILDRMEQATDGLRREIEKDSASPERVLEMFRGFEVCLEEIGVVPAHIREIVRQVERRGGAAKISGAGALSGAAAGSLLVYHPESEVISDWAFLQGLERLDLRLGAEGVRIDPIR